MEKSQGFGETSFSVCSILENYILQLNLETLCKK